MSWDGAGNFLRLFSWVADKNAGLDITASRIDSDTNNITSVGLGNCLTRDGQGQATANLPMAGFRHTGVGNGVARTDYAALGQLQDSTINWTVAGGTSDAITATYTPAITALVDGQICCFRTGTANLTGAPTFSPNGLTARNIGKYNGISLSAGDIPGGGGTFTEVILRYNAANTFWELLNPKTPTTGTITMTANSVADPGFLLCAGQAVSRTGANAALFAVCGTTYGAGNGSTTFNLPDLRGFVVAAPDNMGGVAANRLTTASRGGGWGNINLTGGAETFTLTAGQLPASAPTFTGDTKTLTAALAALSVNVPKTSGTINQIVALNSSTNTVAATTGSWATLQNSDVTVNLTFDSGGLNLTNQIKPTGTISNLGSGTAVVNVQPTITMNYQIAL